MGDADNVRENACRRQAKRLGLVLRKSCARRVNIHDMGGYMILDADRGACVLGSRWDLTLDDVAEYLDKYEQRLREEQAQEVSERARTIAEYMRKQVKG